MVRFLAIYIGTKDALARWNELDEGERKAREAKGIEAWMDWGRRNADAIVEDGSPLGKTKRIAADGISDIRNNATGYVIVESESHEAAAKLFVDHPHFTLFPGDSVEIMECLPMPKR